MNSVRWRRSIKSTNCDERIRRSKMIRRRYSPQIVFHVANKNYKLEVAKAYLELSSRCKTRRIKSLAEMPSGLNNELIKEECECNTIMCSFRKMQSLYYETIFLSFSLNLFLPTTTCYPIDNNAQHSVLQALEDAHLLILPKSGHKMQRISVIALGINNDVILTNVSGAVRHR